MLGLARQAVVVCCSPGTIDRRGLHVCNLASLARAVEAIRPMPDATLIDGFALPGCERPHQALVGGDGRSAAIAAASIVAKVAATVSWSRCTSAFRSTALTTTWATPPRCTTTPSWNTVCASCTACRSPASAYQQLGLLDLEDVPAGVTP